MNAPTVDNSQTLGDELRVRLRNMRLTLVFFLSFVVNLVLAAFGLATPIGLYTLLIYAALLCLLSALMSCVGIDQRELHHAMRNRAQTTRVRTPLHVEFVPYVGMWLVWWIVTELFRAARIVYANNVIIQFFFFPALVLCATYAQSWPVRRSIADFAVLVLQIATAVVLFFPAQAWAPQHTNTLATTLRALVYFFALMLFDYVRPATLDAEASRSLKTDNDALLRRLMREDDELDSNGSDDSTALEQGVGRAELQQRRENLVQVLVAHERVTREHARAYQIAVLNAWILVSPLVVVLVGVFATTLIFFAGTTRRPQPTSVSLAEEQRRTVSAATAAAAVPAAPIQTPSKRAATHSARKSAELARYAKTASVATLTPAPVQNRSTAARLPVRRQPPAQTFVSEPSESAAGVQNRYRHQVYD